MLRKRQLGSADIEVSEMAMGTWELGGLFHLHRNKMTDEEGVLLVERALDCGLNTFDTSDVYGNGRSETILGISLRGKRDKCVLITKTGYLVGVDGAQRIFTTRDLDQPRCYSPRYVSNSCERSLMRLQTDYVDVFLLHSPPMDVVKRASTWRSLERLKDQGKARLVGVSANVEGCLEAVTNGRADVVEIAFSLYDPSAAKELLPLCAEKGVGIIARSPFASGNLFKKRDPLVRQLGFLVNEKRSLTEAAIKYCLSNPHVSTIVTGVHEIKELQANIKACKRPLLRKNELRRLQEIFNA